MTRRRGRAGPYVTGRGHDPGYGSRTRGTSGPTGFQTVTAHAGAPLVTCAGTDGVDPTGQRSSRDYPRLGHRDYPRLGHKARDLVLLCGYLLRALVPG